MKDSEQEYLICMDTFGPVIEIVVPNVNSEMFSRVLFSKNLVDVKFRENKILMKW